MKLISKKDVDCQWRNNNQHYHTENCCNHIQFCVKAMLVLSSGQKWIKGPRQDHLKLVKYCWKFISSIIDSISSSSTKKAQQ